MWSISTGTMFRFLGILFGLALLYFVRDIAIALLFAVILASALEPAVGWLQHRRIPRILAVIFVYLAIALLFVFAVYLFFPLLVEEVRGFASAYPALRERILSGVLEQVEAVPFSSFLPTDLTQNVEGLFNTIPLLGIVSGGVFDVVSAIFGGALSLILIVVFSLYLVAQEKGIENFLRIVTPLNYESYVINLWRRSQKKLGQWLRAQMLLGAIVGVLIFFGLTILGVKNALLFAIVAGLFEIVPVVGPIIASVPAIATAFLDSVLLGFMVIGLYIIVQQIESNAIIPVVMKRAVGLSPLLVLLALLIGAKLGGIIGILLSVPIAAVAVELANDWDKKRRSIMPG